MAKSQDIGIDVNDKLRPRKSFAKRITRWVMATVLIIVTLLTWFISWFTAKVLEEQSKKLFQSVMSVTTQEVKVLFTSVEIAINNTLPDIEANLDDPERLNGIMHQVLRINPPVKGVALAFEPYFYKDKGRWYEPYMLKTSDIDAPDSLATVTKQLGSKNHDYHRSPWYVLARTTGEASWTDPYYDPLGADEMLCSYVQPVRNHKGDIVAVLMVDVSMKWLLDQLHKMDTSIIKSLPASNKNREVYSFIVSNNGTYIVHPDTNRILKHNYFEYARLTPDSLDDKLGREMINGKDSILEFNNPERRNAHSFAFFTPIKNTRWSMAIIVPELWFKLTPYAVGLITFFFMGLGMIFLYFICKVLIRRVAKPLTQFSESASEIANGNLDVRLPKISTKDELLMLHDSFSVMQKSLKQQMEELKVSNEQRGRIEGELKVASDIQMSMIPKVFPPFPERDDIDIAASLLPAKAVGGDLYDFYIRDEKLFFCVGDVSGKGVPASLLMAVTRSLFRTISAHEANPERIISHINESMSEQNESLMFVTFFIGILDLPTGRFRYANAGHDAPLIIGTDVDLLPVDANIPIGVMSDWQYTQQETIIQPGTTIFLYTDGLTEAEDAHNELFGMERILEEARRRIDDTTYTPTQFIEDMSEAVHAFVGEAEQSDDLTMLAIKYTKSDSNEGYEHSITLQNDIQQVPELATFVEEVCEAVGFDMATTMQMNLAMEEAVVNVMNYAYPPNTQGDIYITAQANDVRLKFIIADNGKPFDPTAQAEANITLSAEERPIGGLGIFLVRQIMDSINYEHLNGQNILTLRKRLAAAQP